MLAGCPTNMSRSAAVRIPRRMLTYWLKKGTVQQQDGTMLMIDQMCIGVSNISPCLSLVAQRGPNFEMPATSGFEAVRETIQSIEARGQSVEVSDIVEQVEYAFESKRIRVDSMASDAITFASLGDPLLRLDTITQACKTIKKTRHGQTFNLQTSALVPADELQDTVNRIQVFNV